MTNFKQFKENGITVEAIQASKCANTDQEIFTVTAEYPRAIHAQLLTHRVFSKNSSSSRAVPVNKMIEQMHENPCKVHWTENQPGMQGAPVEDETILNFVENTIKSYRKVTESVAKALNAVNIHKQNINRYIEPFTNIKIVLTSTEWENWDWLRDDPDAQGEIATLARLLKQAREYMQDHEMLSLYPGEYHVPYVRRETVDDGNVLYFPLDSDQEISVQEAIELSISCCAQISYRKLDTSTEKRDSIIPKLFKVRKVHASPTEHQATPIGEKILSASDSVSEFFQTLPEGITHVDRNLTPCSGNFKNFIQYRQLVPNHDKALFKEEEGALTNIDDVIKVKKVIEISEQDVIKILSEHFEDIDPIKFSIVASQEVDNQIWVVNVRAKEYSQEDLSKFKAKKYQWCVLNLLDHLAHKGVIPEGAYNIDCTW